MSAFLFFTLVWLREHKPFGLSPPRERLEWMDWFGRRLEGSFSLIYPPGTTPTYLKLTNESPSMCAKNASWTIY